jgi:transcriptional regulator with XRE-family HTH domain
MEQAMPDDTAKFAERLNGLFATLHPHGRGPYSNEEVAKEIRSKGGDISRAYIAYLRNGSRRNPTMRHMEALGAFFGVHPSYFFDGRIQPGTTPSLPKAPHAPFRRPDTEASDGCRDRGRTGADKLAARATGLSDRSLATLMVVIDRLRALEGLSVAQKRGTTER